MVEQKHIDSGLLILGFIAMVGLYNSDAIIKFLVERGLKESGSSNIVKWFLGSLMASTIGSYLIMKIAKFFEDTFEV
jgi:hypothetical protein